MQRLEVRLKQIPMPELPVEERLKSFDEVPLGLTEEQALAEAARCLQCRNPGCITNCPVGVDIPGFIQLIKRGDYWAAAEKIREKNCLPAVCGRVCPQERLCMAGCRETIGDLINIGGLERFVAGWELEGAMSLPEVRESTGKSVAVVGSGPAGLTVATELAKMGHRVVIFEGLHEAGGVLRYGIPEFRLPKRVVKAEVDRIRRLGVEIKTNVVIGRSKAVDELFEEGFNSIFIATGAGLPNFFNIPGENLCGIYSSNEFLIRINLMKARGFPRKGATPIKVLDRVTVVGAKGLDSARCALRLGAKEVCVLYRQRIVGRVNDVMRAKEEGVKFYPFTKPLKFIGDGKGWVKQIECIRLKPGPQTKSGKRRLVPVRGSEFLHDTDIAIVAVGQTPNTYIARLTPGIEISEKTKTIIVNPETFETTRKGIFAGGDVASGAASVINAMVTGKRAAQSINQYLLKSG